MNNKFAFKKNKLIYTSIFSLIGISILLTILINKNVQEIPSDKEIASNSVSSALPKGKNAYKDVLDPKSEESKSYTNQYGIKSTLLTLNYGTNLSNNIRNIKAKFDSNGTRIPLKLNSTRRCQIGDLDIIQKDLINLKSKNSGNLILSLEPISEDDNSFSPVFRSININEFVLGFEMFMQIKLYHAPANVGVFICNDISKSGRCRSKEKVNISEFGKKFIPGSIESKKEFPEEKIYYFAHLIVDTDGIQFPVSELPNSDLDLMKSTLLSNINFAVSLENTFQELTKISSTTRSMPLKLSNGAIVIDMPRLDRTTCSAS